MKNKYFLKTCALVFFCTFFITTIQGQGHCNLYEISLEEQVAQSSQIVEGKIIAKQSFWDKNRQNIYTVNTVDVYKVFKGQNFETIEIITEGGIVDLHAEVVNPSLELFIEDIGLFMLQANSIEFSIENTSSHRKFKPFASVQGFYKYDIYDNKAINPFHNIDGISEHFYTTITNLTSTEYSQVTEFDIDDLLIGIDESNSTLDAVSITSFSPTTISGGTKSVLTINGTGFGPNPGSVRFRDPDDGGVSFINALNSQIISWTPTQIQVEVPSKAGTGTFRVFDAIGFNAFSTTSLTVNFAQINLESSGIAYQAQHFNQNGTGGMTWRMHSEFNNNAAAKASFLRAFESWVCETGVNWVNGAVTSVDQANLDGTNVIRFDNAAELPAGVLGRNTTYFSGCSSGGVISWFVSELDIVFNDTTNWQFGPANASGAQIDFETVAVHELGHGHQLGHVIDTNKIMHFSVSNGVTNRVLSADDIEGGNFIQDINTSNPVCGNGLMTNSECSLSVDDNFLSNNIKIYPNPAKTTLFIDNPTGISLNNGAIYDISGRLITNINSKLNNNLTSINVSSLSSGIYFLKLNSENASTTFKFIVE
jgi:hypothetical protein